MQNICNYFVWSPQRAMLEWGEQRPWSPADLVERYRLCDSSAECECKGTAFFASFSSFPYTRIFRSLNSCESRMQCQNLHSFKHC